MKVSRRVFLGFVVFQHETQGRDFPFGPSLSPTVVFAISCGVCWKLHYIGAPPGLFLRETTFRQKQYQTQGRDFPHDRFDAVLAKLGDPILPKAVLNLGRGVRCVPISLRVFSGFFVFQHETQERDFPLGPSLAPKMEPALEFSVKHRSAISRSRFSILAAKKIRVNRRRALFPVKFDLKKDILF